MGDELEWGEVTGIGFGGEAKSLVIIGNVFLGDGFAKSDPIDGSVDSVADGGDIIASDAVAVVPAHSIGSFKVGGFVGYGDGFRVFHGMGWIQN